MKSIWENETRQEILTRVRDLSAEKRPQWGRLNAPEMLAHISDQIRMALGDVPARRGSGWMSVPPINYLMIYVVPWPHGAKGPTEAFTTKPVTWDSDLQQLVMLIQRFSEKQDQRSGPEHPLFGKLSGTAWAALSSNHLTHHLRQFGV